MDNLEEIHKFLETYNLLRLYREDRKYEQINYQHWNWISIKKKKLPANKSVGPDGITELYNTFQESVSMLLKIFQKIEKEGMRLNSFNEAGRTLVPKPDKDTPQKENYSPILLVNKDAKIFNKIWAKWIQQ